MRSGISGTESIRLKLWAGPHSWEGNVGYNDTHVAFENVPDPDSVPITYPRLINSRRTLGDNVFVNEDDEGGDLGETFASFGSTSMLKLWGNTYCTPTSGVIVTPYVD